MHVEVTTSHGDAHIELDRPRGKAHALLILTHGAGGGVDTADLIAIRTAAVAAGCAVARVLQPYRVVGRKTPPAPVTQDAAWLELLDGIRAQRGLRKLPLIVGGRSNGARVAARNAEASGATGVVALAYPLHPPGRPEKSRLDELDAAGVPTLVVQGDRDPFGMPPDGPRRLVVVIPGADHALRRELGTVTSTVVGFVTGLVDDARVEA